MSYSCLNMDDLNDQLNLETINLCLKTENTDLETDQIPGIFLLNNFLLGFDLKEKADKNEKRKKV